MYLLKLLAETKTQDMSDAANERLELAYIN
jgi:hypothetical protein